MEMDTLQKIREIKDALNMREPSEGTLMIGSTTQFGSVCTITGKYRELLKSELVRLLVPESEIPL